MSVYLSLESFNITLRYFVGNTIRKYPLKSLSMYSTLSISNSKHSGLYCIPTDVPIYPLTSFLHIKALKGIHSSPILTTCSSYLHLRNLKIQTGSGSAVQLRHFIIIPPFPAIPKLVFPCKSSLIL